MRGSARFEATSFSVFRTAVATNAPHDFRVDVFDGISDLPLFSPDKESDTPDSVLPLAAAVAACDGILIACPEYAHGIPGAFKNALDWLVSRFEIPGKPVMLVHASTRSAYLRAHLHEVLRTISCQLYPEPEFEVHLIRKDRREIDAVLSTEEMRAAMRTKLEAFGRFAAQEG
ncbi:NADPH-dependent FMN reductase [Oricola sp.]|uniref:NADPH-dependent FMN reductase n=1 Tax=Oricola sp. TaxID=1979950 RepID=UPI003510F2FB